MLLAVLVAGLTASADAFAGTASRSGDTVSYVAGAGEANHVIVVEDSAGVRIVDQGAPIVPGANCVAVSLNEVVCTSRLFPRVTVDVADLGDFVLVSGEFLQVRETGGGGNDVLRTAGPRSGPANVLVGGDGNDTLQGGGTAVNRLRGGPGNDVLRGSRGGFDVADYSERTAAVTVDLDGVADDGEAGETDTLTGIEGIVGGTGDDILRGDARSNELVGRGGADSLIGGVGSDFVFGGDGTDTLRGGSGRFDLLLGGRGNDTLSGGDGEDELNGNAGADTVRGGDGRDRIGGGRGRDTLFARDGLRDRFVRGGPGADRARIDQGLDTPVDIESLF